MDNIATEIGKIYCKYNEEIDDFDRIRITDVKKSENDNDNTVYSYIHLNEDFRFCSESGDQIDAEMQFSEEEYNNMRKDWTLLKSDGIVSITNVVAVENEYRKVKDIVGLFFPNNRVTKSPDINQPFVIARQAISNIFDFSGITVGMSVSLDTLPMGYALSDFMENTSTISSKLTHVYKIDTPDELAFLLDNEDTNEIIKDLYDHEVQYKKNTDLNFEYEFNERPENFECIDGYNNSLKGFIDNSDFMNDIFHIIGITIVDFIMESNKPLELDDKLLLSAIYGGIKIDKAVPLKFDYDIDLDAIKMNYFLVEDPNMNLWIVPYTTTPDEIDATGLYNLTEERTSQLQERLMKCVKSYTDSTDDKSTKN